MSQLIRLIKNGCNVQILVNDNITGVEVNYYVDRKNFEIVAGEQTNRFAVNIRGGRTFVTDDITTTNNLVIENIVINSTTDLNNSLPLLMAC